MTIDKAIEDFKTMAKNARNDIINSDDIEPQEKHFLYNLQLELYAKEKEQLATWLEELKAIKEKGRYVQGFRAGYKVAIDDFTNRMLEEGVIGLVQFAKIKEIAEQLKEQK